MDEMHVVQVFVKVPTTGETYQIEIDPSNSCFQLKKNISQLFLENKENLKISEKYYPLIIKMETSNIFIDKEIHYTYATLTKMDEDNYLIETIKQKIEVIKKLFLSASVRYLRKATSAHKIRLVRRLITATMRANRIIKANRFP